jgi:NTE family protein
MMHSTLVLGGGGLWGIGWLTGLAAGLADEGIEIRTAGTLIGTSAGSVVAAQLCGGASLEELFLRQVDPAHQTQEHPTPPEALAALLSLWQTPFESPRARTRATSELALQTPPLSQAERRANMAVRLGSTATAWPTQRVLRITAVDVDSGELHTFDATSGVELIDAITASCAVPGVWPTVPIQGRRYMDGGVWRTPENAHLALGAPSVLVLSPFGAALGAVAGALEQEIAELRTAGARVTLICADPQALASAALGPLNPAAREPAARAGRMQGRRVAAEVRAG